MLLLWNDWPGMHEPLPLSSPAESAELEPENTGALAQSKEGSPRLWVTWWKVWGSLSPGDALGSCILTSPGQLTSALRGYGSFCRILLHAAEGSHHDTVTRHLNVFWWFPYNEFLETELLDQSIWLRISFLFFFILNLRNVRRAWENKLVLLFSGSLPRCRPWPAVGQAKSGRLELNPGLCCGFQGTVAGSWSQSTAAKTQSSALYVGCGWPSGGLNLCTKHLALYLFLDILFSVCAVMFSNL